MFLHFLYGSGILIRLESLCILRSLYERSLGRESVDLLYSLCKKLVLARYLQRDLAVRHIACKINHEALVFIFHTVGNRHVCDPELIYSVIAENVGMGLLGIRDPAVDLLDLLGEFAFLHKSHEEEDDGQIPVPRLR